MRQQRDGPSLRIPEDGGQRPPEAARSPGAGPRPAPATS
jgi:hypothetical protein